MGQIVVDASTIVKLFIKEEYSEAAYKIRDAYVEGSISIAVPSLIEYEVFNALKYSGAFSAEELEATFETLTNYDFTAFKPEKLLANEAIKTSLKYNISVYDAFYVALAKLNNTILYTSDQKLIKTVELSFVKHIKEF